MAVKIINPFYKSPADIDAEALRGVVFNIVKNNSAILGPKISLSELRNLLSAEDAAKLTRPVFDKICLLNGWLIDNPDDTQV